MIVFDQLKKNDPHLRAVTWGVLTGLVMLFAGLWWVQIVSHRHYAENQKAQSFRTVRIPAIRGKILDRQGLALAENKPSYNVILYIDELREQFRAEWSRSQPRQLVPDQPWWESLLTGLGVKSARPPKMKSVPLRLTRAVRTELQVQARYRVASNSVAQVAGALGQPIPFTLGDFLKHYTNQLALPMTILRGLDATNVARLLEGASNPPGVDLEVLPVRSYPGQTMAAHILGYLRHDNSSMEGEVAEFSFRLPDYRGFVGIENAFDSELRGRAGVKSVLVNSLGYRQSENVWEPALAGRNVVLTLDYSIQQAAETALREVRTSTVTRGAAIVMDPHTGNLLAIVSTPAFDANAWMRRLTPEENAFLQDEKLKPQINRAMQENYAPGSIFKVVTGLSALEHGLDPAERMKTLGHIKIPGRNRPINDLAPPGEYDFQLAFIHSSNAYFISNGMRHGGIEALVSLGQRFHFGERTHLLPRQETAGFFPNSQTIRRGWYDGDTANLCIGQGRIAVSPLQIAVMIAAVANGGKVLWPRLVDRIEPADPQSDEPVEHFPVRPPRDQLGVSARSLALTREAMVADVEQLGGTGSRALVSGFRIGGKTGTAEVTDLQNRVIDRTTWFASCGPMENPRYVVVVMVESGSSGGGTCAPVVGKIYKRIQELELRGRLHVAANPHPRPLP